MACTQGEGGDGTHFCFVVSFPNEVDRIFTHPIRRRNRRIMDDCNSLEQVTIYYADSDLRPSGMDSFIWADEANWFGQRRLRVKLAGTFPPITETRFVAICDRLRECCILELANVTVTPPVCLSMSEHFPLRAVHF